MNVPLYQAIADQLTRQIKDQVYRPGEKLPSIRRQAQQHQVSVATIKQALSLLETRRLVESRPRSGYVVRAAPSHQPLEPQATAPSQPAAVSIHGRAMTVFHTCEQSRINLGTAYPDSSYLPQRALQRIGRKLLRYQMPQLMDAHFSPGELKLRHQLAQRLSENGCELTEQQLIITNGCQEALGLCLQACCQKGDMVAIESPAFVGLLQLIEALGLKALEIPCSPEAGISLPALELALEQWPIKAIALVPSFSNPLGSLMPTSHRQQLVELITRYRIPLIEDDLFGDLSHDSQRQLPIKAFDTEGRVLYCSSVSKSIAPGFRVGWIAAGVYQEDIAFRKSFTNVSAPAMSQLIVAEFMSTRRYERHLRALCTAFARQVQQAQHWISRYFPASTRCSTPEGGYVIWLQLPEHVSGWQLYQQAAEQGIGVLPGVLFSATDKYQNYLRLNVALPDEALEHALKQLGALVSACQEDTARGTAVLAGR